jgi:small subunit ribosomal protein S1
MNGDEDLPELPPEEEGESFAELFASYETDVNSDVRVGDKVKGEIISIGKDAVFLDIGAKIDGVAEKQALLDEIGDFPCKVGDELTLFVTARTESEIHLSPAVAGIVGEHLLKEAYENRIPVEGKVTGTCKGGFDVEILKRRAFCPVSQLDLSFIENPEVHIGEIGRFLITRLEGGGKNIVVSRRKLLAMEQEAAQKAFFETLQPDAVLEGRVTRVVPYGAFVEIGPGVEGMVHVSELSWSRVSTPQDAVAPGDGVRVKVLDIGEGQKPGQKKISLSIKQVDLNPWETVRDRFRAGARVRGKVTRCAPFGAFVEIAPGIEGLVHISELSYTRRVTKPEEVVQPGETVSVLIKDIDAEKRRISLSLREAEGDPWVEFTEKLKVGRTVSGTLEKKESFGFFVTLAPGVTGLLPKSKISRAADPSAIERLRAGDAVSVTLEAIDLQNRRISLSTADDGDVEDWKKYTGAGPSPGMGNLGEELRRAMAKKKG